MMSRITDYGFLFQTTFGTSKTNLVNNIQLSQMNSSSVQKQLKAAGTDTNGKKMDKDDRLSAGWTMEQYEHQYRQAFAKAAKAADPTWKAGKPIPAGALDGITRKSVDIKL